VKFTNPKNRTMKKLVLLALPTLLLFSCGEGEKTQTSNRIATESPKVVAGGNNSANNNAVNIEAEIPVGSISTMEFDEMEFDFGNVFYPSENLHTFRFKNTGNEPIIIASAKASCGCTIPKKPEEPVMPGEYGELDVIFRPKESQQGTPVTKRITVVANTNPKETYLNIKSNVLKGM
jgi:hypothetical protein